MEKDQQPQQTQVVHSFDQGQNLFTRNVIIVFFITLMLGIVSGYLISMVLSQKSKISSSGEEVASQSGAIEKGAAFGSADTKTFKDMAEGMLKEGGMDGEGAFHLERPGGSSQNVYLTSSVIDLSQFEGKKVKVWGETNKAKKAGWLMDVGKLQILE